MNDSKFMSGEVDVIQHATEAARQAGAYAPEAVAEYLVPHLTTVDTVSGPQVVVSNGLDYESLDGVFARMQVTENVAALFTGGKLNVTKLDPDLYQLIRKHKPELLGLRKNR
jgi:hypothetical protein